MKSIKVYRVAQKMAQFSGTPLLHQILTYFQNYFTIRIRRKCIIILSLKIPPHLKCVATLPCEMSRIFKATTENKTSVTTRLWVYLQGIRVNFVYEGHWVKVKVTAAKSTKFSTRECKTSIDKNSGSIEDTAVKSTCSIGFGYIADQMVWPPSLSRDWKYTHSRVVCLRLDGNLID